MFYTRFIELCEKNGKKHYSVLSELNINSGCLSGWKRGCTPSVYVLYDIAKYFGTTIEYLIERQDL